MHPVIFTIGPFTIYSYGLMLVIGFLTGVSLAQSQARREHISPDLIFNLAFCVFIAGLVGARLLFIAQNIRFYLRNPLEILMLQHGGLAIFGGLIAGMAAGLIYLKAQKAPVYKVMDVLAPAAALGQAFGRIGCFLNGCCYGKAAAGFCLYSPPQEACLIPTQLYSSLLLAVIFIILRFLQERPHTQGEILYAYLLLYSAKRFAIEFLRDDNPPIIGSLTFFHLMSVALFIVSFIMLMRRKRAPLQKYAKNAKRKVKN